MKFKKIKFKNHNILGNLELNFEDSSGSVSDTIILAGENGVGKSTILNCLYSIVTYKVDFEVYVELIKDNETITLDYFFKQGVYQKPTIYVKINGKEEDFQEFPTFQSLIGFKGIFSDVDINFNSKSINHVTSMTVDVDKVNERSSDSLPTSIKQLFVDIQTLDSNDLLIEYNKFKSNNLDTNNINLDYRMNRFTKAFSSMFDEVKYFGIDNINGQKQIIFDKKGKKIPIDSLSSGEKQIIYRGAFLLKNLKSLNGCIVFIDEPEISMHPKWQQKILTYYKSMFRDTNGVQTSQMFVVTHSPFIIHNSSRQNDKVIVLSKNANDQIISMDKPEYYKCDSVELVEDAFNLKFFLDDRANKSIVYVEGRTDEKYLNKALEIYKYKDLPFEIKWCGYLDNKGQERNTGSSGLDKIKEACITLNLSYKTVLLYDCDTNKRYSEYNNVIAKSVKTYDNNYIKKGIENSLIITEKPGNTFYSSKTKVGDYNETITYQEFDKMKYCDYICSLSIEKLEIIFENLKAEIDELIALFK